MRIHYGSHTECIYSMQSYGIMEGTIPLSALDYSPFFHHHQIWLHDRVVLDNKKDIKRLDKSVPKIERASSPSSQSFATGLSDFSMTDASDKILPRPGDMLFGKDSCFHGQLGAVFCETPSCFGCCFHLLMFLEQVKSTSYILETFNFVISSPNMSSSTIASKARSRKLISLLISYKRFKQVEQDSLHSTNLQRNGSWSPSLKQGIRFPKPFGTDEERGNSYCCKLVILNLPTKCI